MANPSEFWQWFTANQARINAFQSGDEALLDDILINLHRYNDQLYFEIATHDPVNELIITAEGNVEEFQSVTDLIASAPDLPEWTFIAFRPPAGFGFITRYEGIDYNPEHLWFLPMISNGPEQLLGLRVCIPEYDEDRHQHANSAMWILLDTGLGEEMVSREIHYIETAPLPANPAEEGYIELTEIKDYIQWRNSSLEPSLAHTH